MSSPVVRGGAVSLGPAPVNLRSTFTELRGETSKFLVNTLGLRRRPIQRRRSVQCPGNRNRTLTCDRANRGWLPNRSETTIHRRRNITHKARRNLLLPSIAIMVAILGVGFFHVSSQEASAACWLNLTYFTGQKSGTIDGVSVNSKVQIRGYILPISGDPNLGNYASSCLHGQVESKASSTIDQLSWEA